MHIVFQVLNFVYGEECLKYDLLPIDKLLLIALAKHHGPKGIYPSQQTLAKELHITERHTRERLCYLRSKSLIFIDDTKRQNHYKLIFLSLIPEPQFLYQDNDTGTTVP